MTVHYIGFFHSCMDGGPRLVAVICFLGVTNSGRKLDYESCLTLRYSGISARSKKDRVITKNVGGKEKGIRI